MKSSGFKSFLQNVYNTQDEEISCTECFALVSRFVEVELSGEDAATDMPRLKQHLDQCPACHEEYETLRDLQRLENEGGLPSSDELQDLIP